MLQHIFYKGEVPIVIISVRVSGTSACYYLTTKTLDYAHMPVETD